MLFFFKFLFELFYLVFNMGRTVPSFRPALEHEIKSWKNFKRALRAEEQKIFTERAQEGMKKMLEDLQYLKPELRAKIRKRMGLPTTDNKD